jgi:outer membrane scaffolding protein for murein synthesis (MipA/OmpV family)
MPGNGHGARRVISHLVRGGLVVAALALALPVLAADDVRGLAGDVPAADGQVASPALSPSQRVLPSIHMPPVNVPPAAVPPARVPLEPLIGPRVPVAVERPLWELGLGIGYTRFPDYPGSDQSSNYVLPLPYVIYRGQRLRADRNGARALLLSTEYVDLDVSVAATLPASSNDNRARRGMPDLRPTVEVGPNVRVGLLRTLDRRAQLELQLPLREALTVEASPRAIGMTFSPNLNLDLNHVFGDWHANVLGGPVFADRHYNRYFYAVDEAYVAPGRPAYDAPGGYAGWRVQGSMSRRIGRAWVGAFLRHENLNGAVFLGSPLVRRRNTFAFGFGVSWVFATSSQMVATDE